MHRLIGTATSDLSAHLVTTPEHHRGGGVPSLTNGIVDSHHYRCRCRSPVRASEHSTISASSSSRLRVR